MLTIHSQSRALASLQRALRAGRLAHTWLFAGPFGTGKFTLARELAKTQLCDHPTHTPNGTSIPQLGADFPLKLPCNACESCRAVDADAHPDLHIITKELIRFHDKTGKSKGTTLSIDVIRGEITGDTESGKEAKIYKRSFRGRGKWFIIDEADLMDTPAQNSLLKTLEEPPAESYLVLITTSPQELLSTIRSRSQTVLFNELPAEAILPQLVATGLSHDDAALLARIAHGSLGRATRWAGDIANAEKKNTADAERKAKRGKEDDDDAPRFTPGGILTWTRTLTATLDAMVQGKAHASTLAAQLAEYSAEYAKLQLIRDPLASEDRFKRDGLIHLLAILADYFDDRLRQGLGAPHAVPLPANTAGLDPDTCRAIIAAIRTAEAQIDSNANTNLLLSATATGLEDLIRTPVA